MYIRGLIQRNSAELAEAVPIVLQICWYKCDVCSVIWLQQKVTVLSAKSDSDVMFCLQSYQGLRIDISLVY